jgi:O-antigen ligase
LPDSAVERLPAGGSWGFAVDPCAVVTLLGVGVGLASLYHLAVDLSFVLTGLLLAILAFRDRWLPVAIAALLLIPESPVRVGGMSLLATYPAYLVLGVSSVVRMLPHLRRGIPTVASLMGFSVVLMGIAGLVSLVAAVGRLDAFRMLENTVTFAGWIMLTTLYWRAQAVDRPLLILNRFIWGLVVAMALAAPWGLLQSLRGTPAENPYVFFGTLRRASASFWDPNFFASLIVFCWPLVLVIGDLNTGARRTLAGGAAGLAVVALFFTLSRAAFLGFGTALVVLLLLVPRRRVVLLALVLLMATTLVAGGVVWQRVAFTFAGEGTPLGLEGFGAYYRLLLWWQAADAFIAHPLTGVGFRAFQELPPATGLLADVGQGRVGTAPHNNALRAAAEMGVPGLMAFGVFLLGFLKISRSAVRGRDCSLALLANAMLAGFIGLQIEGMFIDNHFNYRLSSVVWLIAGLVRACSGGVASQPLSIRRGMSSGTAS